jgi:hypothetical protein
VFMITVIKPYKFRSELVASTVPSNKNLVDGTVTSSKNLVDGTVASSKNLVDGTPKIAKFNVKFQPPGCQL